MRVRIEKYIPARGADELTPGMVVETVDAPDEHAHLDGVWVKGKHGAVRLLPRRPREFTIIHNSET